jgi:glycosyltransferase involved in cell wall biosynthesis
MKASGVLTPLDIGKHSHNPNISVCMATFNGARNIREQLDSILRQLSEGDEIVISDDGSTDGTLELITSFAEPRIKLLMNEIRLGPARNFERAIQHASGSIVCLSDQDDVWRRDKIEVIQNAFHRTKALAIVSDARIIDGEGLVISRSFFKWRGSGPGFLKNFLKNGFLGCCMAFRAQAKSFLLPFPTQINMHDEWIGLTCSLAGKVEFINDTLIDYRRHDANVTNMSHGSYGFMIKKRLDVISAVSRRLPSILAARRNHFHLISDEYQ